MPDHLRAIGSWPDARHWLAPQRMAQPQGQPAAGKRPWPDTCIQHRSELCALSGDVCGTPGDLVIST